jgi:hypothetical protein
MKKQKPKIIEDKKLRGEWAESVFMERASAHGLTVSKPWGEMSSYDFVIGRTGRFVSVQVKSTLSKLKTGYVCTVRGGHKAYSPGSFDFLAAYVIPEDSWYIVPAEVIQGKNVLTLYPKSPATKYEKYREAWDLLREASKVSDDAESVVEETLAVRPEAAVDQNPSGQNPSPKRFPASALERLEAAGNFFRNQLERGGTRFGRPDDEG